MRLGRAEKMGREHLLHYSTLEYLRVIFAHSSTYFTLSQSSLPYLFNVYHKSYVNKQHTLYNDLSTMIVIIYDIRSQKYSV